MLRHFSFLMVFPLFSSCGPGSLPNAGITGSKSSASGSVINGSMEEGFDLTKCGFDVSKPASVISTRRLSTVPQLMTVTSKILGGILTTQSEVTINGMSIAEDSLVRSVNTFSADATPVVTSDDLSDTLAKMNSGFAADLVPSSERGQLPSVQPDWRGVFCSYQPAIRLERGAANKVIVELDRPIPVSPLGISDPSRLRAEVGVSRLWTGITAKVVESADPEIFVGTTWIGSVSSDPISPVIQVDHGAEKLTIKSDLAFKTTYDFGGVAALKALGLPRTISWYLDVKTKSYHFVQVDFGDGTLRNFFRQ